jgi:hypothetical protein
MDIGGRATQETKAEDKASGATLSVARMYNEKVSIKTVI